MLLAQLLRGPHPFVGAGRRHADVGDDDVGVLAFDRCDEVVEVFAGAHDLDLRGRVEEPHDGLSDEIVVLGYHDPDRHARTLRRDAVVSEYRCRSRSWCSPSSPAGASRATAGSSEQIKRYDVDITIEPTGTLLVRETIDYDFGVIPHHGIFRDIPARVDYTTEAESPIVCTRST